MKTITIQINVPDEFPEHNVQRLIGVAEMEASPDFMSIWWSIEDVTDRCREDITDDEAREILEMMDKYHDCTIGVSWDTMDVYIDEVLNQREETAEEIE